MGIPETGSSSSSSPALDSGDGGFSIVRFSSHMPSFM